MDQFCVILPAAGRSSRFGGPDDRKIHVDLKGKAVWLRAIEPFVNRDDVAQAIVVVAPDDREEFERRYRASLAFWNIQVVEGGAERSDSIARALEHVRPECDYVAIHDAARPCLTSELVDAVFQAARRHGAALPAVPAADTIKTVGPDRTTTGTIPRQGVYLAQTPQVFRRDWLTAAYAERDRLGAAVTDDSQLLEASGRPCAIVDGSPYNLKITTRADLILAAAVLQTLAARPGKTSARPFPDEPEGWADSPKIKPSDLFGD